MANLDPDLVTIPSTPNPTLATLIGTGVRGVLQLISAGMAIFGATCSFCNPSATLVAEFSAAILFLGTWAWSFWQKIRAEQKNHAGSVASAEASLARGVPTALKVV